MRQGVLIDSFTIDDLEDIPLKATYQYWLDKKGTRDMPSRAEVFPEDIAPYLSNLCLVDIEPSTNRYRFRLVGTQTVKALGFEITGQYLDKLPSIEKVVKPRYDWLVEHKRPYYIADQLKWSAKTFIRVRTLGLPLSSNGKDVDIIMFVLHYVL